MGTSLPNALSGSGAGPAELRFVEGVSASMGPVEAVIRELAQGDVPVLLLAEPGAGKRATAQRIHEMSRRRTQPFRCFQCSELKPEDLELSRWEQDAGTVYLEELADLSAGCQGRLLEALSQPAVSGIGTSEGVRLICGSARHLEAEVKSGRLREDLYYRISGVCLRLPPLRQRREDIPFLMGHFLRKFARDFQRPVPDLSAQTLRVFLDYAWPGNLRELEYASRVLVALGDEHVAMGGLKVLLRKPEAARRNSPVSLKAASRAASREAEKELILSALTRTRWNRRRAAEELQISYKALLYKLKQIGFEGTGRQGSAETA